MKSAIYLTVIAVLFFCLAQNVCAEKLEIGAKFPLDKLTQEKKSVDNTIIAFMPSLTYDCEYASMLTQSFYYYFDQRLAFEGLKKSPATRIFLVVNDKLDAAKSTQNIIGGMNVIYDESGELFSHFGVKIPLHKNFDSTVLLLDSNNNIAFIDESYRSQGEHLKPLENKLKELNGIYKKVDVSPKQKPLKVGDDAPDFRVNEKQKLSDLRGNVVLISFYPAAFSGTLPIPPIRMPNGAINITFSQESLMSCSLQLGSLDTTKFKKDPKRIVISSSTNSLLIEWRKVLTTKNIEHTNDADYSISTKYLSYNPSGYNNRVSVIINQQGKIAYVDNDFSFNTEAILIAKIEELYQKENK